MKRIRKSKAFAVMTTILSVVVLILAGLFLTPTTLGGKATFIIVNGNSMEPDFHLGDLVILRKSRVYQIGDVAAYRNPQMDGNVIHRIVAINEGHYIFQGDHNEWMDAYFPVQEELLGKLWLHIPGLGNGLFWTQTAWWAAGAGVIAGGFAMIQLSAGKKYGKSTGNAENKKPVPRQGLLFAVMAALGIICISALGLLIYSFTLPAVVQADDLVYEQTGAFSYSANDTTGIYEAGYIQTGDPIFVTVVCELPVMYQYAITGPSLEAVSGTHQMTAILHDTKSGWHRTLPLQAVTAFTGNAFVSSAEINLCDIQKTVSAVEQLAGIHLSSYTLEILSSVSASGTLAGQALTDTFETSFVFYFDPVHFYLPGGDAKLDALQFSRQDVIASTQMVDNTITLPGFAAPIRVAGLRSFSIGGIVFSVMGLSGIGFVLFRKSQKSKVAAAELKYGSLMIKVYEPNPARVAPVTDVSSMDDLAKMAQYVNGMILHAEHGYAHYYFVRQNEMAYRFVIHERDKHLPRFHLRLPSLKRKQERHALSTVFSILAVVILAGVLFSVTNAFAANVSVPPIHMEDQSMALTANQLKPDVCNGIDLTGIISGAGVITGTSGNDLLLGSSGNDTINGGGGDDCILAGDGDDMIDGNEGNDVCAGGTGNNSFTLCETEIP